MNKKKAVIISCFDWYEKRLKTISECLSQEFDVTIILSDFDHIQKSEVSVKYAGCTYIHVKKYKSNLSLSRISSHIGFAECAYKKIKEIKPNLIYALVPPNYLAEKCIAYKSKNKECEVVLDIIDMWPESMPISRFKNTIIYKKWKNMRNNSVAKADYVVCECNLYINELGDIIKCPSSVLPLFKSQTEEETIKVYEKIDCICDGKEKLCLGYLGSINSLIDISLIMEIIIELKKRYSVVVKIIGAGNTTEEFLATLKECDVEVEYNGKVFDELKKIEILSTCDYALNIMKESVKVGLTIKSIDYFSYGVPLINNIKEDTWNMIEQNDIGINYEGKSLIDKIRINDKENHKRVFEFYQNNFSQSAFEFKVKKLIDCINGN